MLHRAVLVAALLASSAATQAAVPEACRASGYTDELTASRALDRVRQALPATEFKGARGPVGPCLVELEMGSGGLAYTDPSGRYFFMGALIDLRTGKGTEGRASSGPPQRTGDSQ